VRRRSLILRSHPALPMRQDAVVRKEFQSRLGEDVEHRERSVADADGRATAGLPAETKIVSPARIEQVAATAEKTVLPGDAEPVPAAQVTALRRCRAQPAQPSLRAGPKRSHFLQPAELEPPHVSLAVRPALPACLHRTLTKLARQLPRSALHQQRVPLRQPGGDGDLPRPQPVPVRARVPRQQARRRDDDVSAQPQEQLLELFSRAPIAL
jgi:hypothetical protein